MVVSLKDNEFEAKTKKGSVIIDFYADWCGPCKMMSPIFEKVAGETKDVSFFKLDVDSNPESADKAGVRSIPTLLFLKDGEEVDRITGVLPEPAFKEKVSSAFK
ncbi:thioredoxin [Candidatus Woesearchaeota archaeon]|nr:thioredoxin [Candidatus Woesearchaeota archaeon]